MQQHFSFFGENSAPHYFLACCSVCSHSGGGDQFVSERLVLLLIGVFEKGGCLALIPMIEGPLNWMDV